MAQASSEAIAKRYGGAAVADIAARHGGTPVEDAAAPAKPSPQTTPAQTQGGGMLATLGDYVAGLGKSALGVIEGGGNLIRSIPGVRAAEEATGAYVDTNLSSQPTNTAQSAGKLTGDVAQFFTPASVVARLPKGAAALKLIGPKAAEVLKSAGLTMLQGGSAGEAGVSGAITAAVPGAGAAKRVSTALDQSATKSVLRALGPTKEGMKETARQLAPEMLERGIAGTRPEMLALATDTAKKVGAAKGVEVARLAAEGKTVAADAIRSSILQSSKALVVPAADGVPRVIPGAEPVIRQLGKLDEFVAALGPDIPFDKADKVKQAWQKIVAKSGLYGHRMGASATDNAKAWVFREGASGMKKALDEAGDEAYLALNKEYAFWKGLKTVLTETERRTSSQAGTGLVAAGVGMTGASVGAYTGDSTLEKVLTAAAYGVAGRQIVKLLQSPRFATKVSAPLKKRFAEALASGGTATIASSVRAILASLPATTRAELEQETP